LKRTTDRAVRVMTWNIHGTLGRNRRYDLSRVVEIIRRNDPDIVALQEVDSRRPRAEVSDDPFSYLQRELGKHGIGAKSISAADGEYGQMLISRFPMSNTEIVDISHPEREPRRAIRTSIETPAGMLSLIATHLGLSARERNAQLRTLLDLVGKTADTTVMLGDFNDWIWAGSVRNVLRGALPGRTRFRTFPSFFPLLRLDRIYCRPAQSLVGGFVDREGRSVSDHLPVFADVRIDRA